MPIGTKNDLKVYDPRIRGGYVETLLQNVRAFNGASRGAIRLISNRKPGVFEFESLFKNITDIIESRDPTSTADVDDKKLTQDEIVRVKVNRRIGPVAITIDALRKAGLPVDPNTLNVTAGVMAARATTTDYLNTGVRALVGALNPIAASKFTEPTNGTMKTTTLVNGLSKFGDQSDALAIWVMHSKAYFDLVANQIAEKIDGISNFNIAQGQPVTLNRPVLVTDSDALTIKDGNDVVTDYLSLGLPVGALEIEDTESEYISLQEITGKANLFWRMQGEYAYNLGVLGFKWDVTNGGENPSNTALGTSGNWDAVIADVKGRAGVVLQTK